MLPGFGLAKLSADVFDKDRKVVGLILARHGIFTFGADAREAYECMIEMVTRAETHLSKNRKAVFVAGAIPQQALTLTDIAPILRGACAVKDEKNEGAWTRFIVEFRANAAILDFVNGRDVADYARRGVITPDHTIRTKNWPVVLPAADAGDGDWRVKVRAAVATFVEDYKTYFVRQNARVGGGRTMLDPAPRVALIPGAGLVGLLLHSHAKWFDEPAVLHTGGASCFASATVETEFKMMPHVVRHFDPAIGDGAHQIDAAARTVVLVP